MRADQSVSLSKLSRRLGAHYDLLLRLCACEEIEVDHREDGVRCLPESSVPRLFEALEMWRHRPRPYARRIRPAR